MYVGTAAIPVQAYKQKKSRSRFQYQKSSSHIHFLLNNNYNSDIQLPTAEDINHGKKINYKQQNMVSKA